MLLSTVEKNKFTLFLFFLSVLSVLVKRAVVVFVFLFFLINHMKNFLFVHENPNYRSINQFSF